MMRIVNIVLVLVMLGAATWTYSVKHIAENKVSEIKRLERSIELEKDTIDLLQADWAYLSQPARLQTLADRYASELQLQSTAAQQIIHPGELPAPPVTPIGDPVADIIAGGAADPMTTGSVEGN
ncbi:cell division protein FtsL [Oricola sp.]|uniref:cell division protein FtsL n=1 Tax=Oricola sp. TaxID=1979950 RepID=UPI003BAA5F05